MLKNTKEYERKQYYNSIREDRGKMESKHILKKQQQSGVYQVKLLSILYFFNTQQINMQVFIPDFLTLKFPNYLTPGNKFTKRTEDVHKTVDLDKSKDRRKITSFKTLRSKSAMSSDKTLDMDILQSKTEACHMEMFPKYNRNLIHSKKLPAYRCIQSTKARLNNKVEQLKNMELKAPKYPEPFLFTSPLTYQTRTSGHKNTEIKFINKPGTQVKFRQRNNNNSWTERRFFMEQGNFCRPWSPTKLQYQQNEGQIN